MLKEKAIIYLGVSEPNTLAEIEVEITGLEHAVKQAEEQIARYRQSVAVFKLKAMEQTDGLQEEGGTEKANQQTEA
jgi:hypothetical protein